MEVTKLEQDSIKLKAKKTLFLIDPNPSIAKTTADAIILLKKNGEPNKVTEYRVIIEGPGDYEVAGVKVSGISTDNGVAYSIESENMTVSLAKASTLAGLGDKAKEHQVAIINTDVEYSQTIVGHADPKILILYGEKTDQWLKELGKETVEKTKKATFTRDQILEEMKLIVLE